jgi:hypothetical protein
LNCRPRPPFRKPPAAEAAEPADYRKAADCDLHRPRHRLDRGAAVCLLHSLDPCLWLKEWRIPRQTGVSTGSRYSRPEPRFESNAEHPCEVFQDCSQQDCRVPDCRGRNWQRLDLNAPQYRSKRPIQRLCCSNAAKSMLARLQLPGRDWVYPAHRRRSRETCLAPRLALSRKVGNVQFGQTKKLSFGRIYFASARIRIHRAVKDLSS